MRSPAPAVTVIIPTYNWSAVLPYSIGSALLQTFTDIEVLVVGDGCTDDSADVVASIGDPRVRWINLPANSGHQAAPNNEGLRQARGSLIAYLGHDDLWLPHHLACLVAAHAAGADLAYSVTRMVRPPDCHPRPVELHRRFAAGMWLPPSSVAHRRHIVERLGGWRHYRELSEHPETELWARIHDAGFRIEFVPRLGVIKFPAASRANVYRQRPCHEQDAWLARIRGEADIEATELAAMLGETAERLLAEAAMNAATMRYGTLIKAVLRETARRARRRLREPFPDRSPPRPGQDIDERRSFKGLAMLPRGEATAALPTHPFKIIRNQEQVHD